MKDDEDVSSGILAIAATLAVGAGIIALLKMMDSANKEEQRRRRER